MNIIASFWFLVLVMAETTAFSFRPSIIGRRQFQPIVSQTKLRNTGVEIPITEELECTLHLMYKQSMAWSLVAVATELIRPSLPGSPFVRHLLPLYVQAALTAKTLSAAAQRKRLDGTTFRLLNVGLLLSCIPTVMSTLPIAISFPRFVLSNEIMGAFAATVRSVHAYITMYTAYDALMLYGLPSVSLKVVGPLSGMYLALTMCTVYGFPMTGAGLMLENALTACILFALHGAAAAGNTFLLFFNKSISLPHLTLTHHPTYSFGVP